MVRAMLQIETTAYSICSTRATRQRGCQSFFSSSPNVILFEIFAPREVRMKSMKSTVCRAMRLSFGKNSFCFTFEMSRLSLKTHGTRKRPGIISVAIYK